MRLGFAPIILAASAILALSPNPSDAAGLLVSFDELQQKLADPNLRLLDARPREEYEKGHAPGAVWVDAKAAQKLAARPGGLTDRDAWTAWSAPLAIGPDSVVLIFDGAKQLEAARLWWLLSYLGVPKAGLINGNFPTWVQEKRPVTTDVPQVEPRPFPVAFRADRHATRDETLAIIKVRSAAIIDARSHAEYVGEQKLSKRSGHIPDACRVEWSDLVTADGRFLDEAKIRAKIAGLNLPASGPVVTHCQGGGRASVDAFVFERLGFPTRNFYLGWSDWGNAEDTPVVEGEGAEAR